MRRVSDESGFYQLLLLQPGTYTLTAKKTGFRQATRERLRLEVNQRADVDLTLQVGSVTETVEVVGSAPLLESSTSSVGQVIESKAISDLPLNGRNFVQLAILSNGAIGAGYGPQGTIGSGTRADDTRGGAELMVNGNREMSNNYMLDGVDNNFRRNALIIVRPTVESIQEFKMQTNLFGAEQGRNSGATVNVITKSGTNAFPRQRLRVPAQRHSRRAQLLQRREYQREASVPAEPVRRKPRRPDCQEQVVLLRRL